MILQEDMTTQTTLLSSRSQIEILNPNELDFESNDMKKSPLALLAATCSNIGKESPLSKPTASVSPVAEIKSTSPVTNQLSKDSDTLKSRSAVYPNSHADVSQKLLDAKIELNHLQALHNKFAAASYQNSLLDLTATCDPNKLVSMASSLGLQRASSTMSNFLPLSINALNVAAAAAMANQQQATINNNSCVCQHCHSPSSPLIASGGHSPVSKPSQSPYVAYISVKTLHGNTSLVPICRDPFCLSCQNAIKLAVSGQTSQNSCSQCSHYQEKSPAVSPTSPLPIIPFGLSSALTPQSDSTSLLQHPLLPLSVNTALASSLLNSSLLPYPFMPVPQPPASVSPPEKKEVACHWVSETGLPCGKHFATVDKLMQHIRSFHADNNLPSPVSGKPSVTTAASSPRSSESPLNPLASLSNLSKKTGLHGAGASPAYSSLACALGRYHPYSKPASAAGLPTSSLPLASTLGAYYPYTSPYLLYDVPRA